MKLWKRAAGALKDHNSILLANLTRKSALRNPDIEAAVIKATSHDDSFIDYRNAQRVFTWVRVSSSNLKPMMWAVSMRVDKTRCWAVALKSLMLVHGVFCCCVHSIHRLGRLPFDLSGFTDGHASHAKTWPYNAFIRAYYAFLDKKSAFLYLNSQEEKSWRNKQQKQTQQAQGKADEEAEDQKLQLQKISMMQQLLRLQKLQDLMDMVLQIKPQTKEMIGCIVLEAMDCVIIELFDIYSKISNRIAAVLMNIYSAGKHEAAVALRVLQKAKVQTTDLSVYMELCQEMGLTDSTDCPVVCHISEEDIRELELIIINGFSEKFARKDNEQKDTVGFMKKKDIEGRNEDEDEESSKKKKVALKTIITSKWEVFDEDVSKMMKNNGETSTTSAFIERSMMREKPFTAASFNPQPNHVYAKSEDLPDLISFW